MFHEDFLFSPLILLFSGGLFSQDRKSTKVTIHDAAKFKIQLVGLPLHLLFRSGGSAFEGKGLNVSLWHVDKDAASPPWCYLANPEIALDNVCAKFFCLFVCLHLSVFTEQPSSVLSLFCYTTI